MLRWRLEGVLQRILLLRILRVLLGIRPLEQRRRRREHLLLL